jgi:hypothetical protein
MDVNSKEYCAIAGWGPFYTHFRVWVINIVEDPTMTVNSNNSVVPLH